MGTEEVEEGAKERTNAKKKKKKSGVSKYMIKSDELLDLMIMKSGVW